MVVITFLWDAILSKTLNSFERVSWKQKLTSELASTRNFRIVKGACDLRTTIFFPRLDLTPSNQTLLFATFVNTKLRRLPRYHTYGLRTSISFKWYSFSCDILSVYKRSVNCLWRVKWSASRKKSCAVQHANCEAIWNKGYIHSNSFLNSIYLFGDSCQRKTSK